MSAPNIYKTHPEIYQGGMRNIHVEQKVYFNKRILSHIDSMFYFESRKQQKFMGALR